MKTPWPLIGISTALLVILALTFVHPRVMVSPGDLSASHAGLAQDCFACHAPFRGAEQSRCETCHKVADIGLRNTKGAVLAPRPARPPFHQALIDRDCMACHVGHQGAHPHGPAGKPFAHAMLQPDLRGRCETCHAPPADDFHRKVTTGCAQCHQTLAWTPATFDHARFFRLDGDHNVPCATCHLKGDFSTFTCASCHAPARMRAKHLEEGVRGDITNCVQCHRGGDDEGEGHGERGDEHERE